VEGIDIGAYFGHYGLNIIGSILILFIGLKVAKYVKKITVKRLMGRENVDETLLKFAADILYFLVAVVVVLAALTNIGVNVTSFIAILGAVGLAIGLALKDSLANIGASVLILVFRPFKIGDFIDAGGVTGTVEEINLFSTALKTADNKAIIVPNGSIVGGAITNFSAKETRRVDMVFGIGYDDDLKKAKEILVRIANEDERVLKDPAPFVAVSELADSSVNFVVRLWVKSSDYWGVHFDTIEKVKCTFDAEGITIPYPQLDVHTKQ